MQSHKLYIAAVVTSKLGAMETTEVMTEVMTQVMAEVMTEVMTEMLMQRRKQ